MTVTYSRGRTVTFGYDNRGRLISEVRSDVADPTRNYNIAYKYDQGGNRTLKTEFLGPGLRHETTYTYDIEDAVTFGSANNRLMKSIKEEVSAGGIFMSSSTVPPSGEGTTGGSSGSTSNAFFGETRTLLETTWYYYNKQGNVTRVVTNQAGSDVFSSTRFVYAVNGRAVAYVSGETWQYPFGDISRCPAVPDITYAREFRYDGPRQRYLNRELSLTRVGSTWNINTLSDVWSDYDGAIVYGDFTVDAGIPTDQRSFLPGLGKVDPASGSGGAFTKYYGTDLIGTTRLMTDSGGNAVESTAYSAFGEQVGGAARRYGYAGSSGYQTDETANFPFTHVGTRYYDPSSGRFLQRDPIGILGGANVYGYVGNNPVTRTDPSGLGPLDWLYTGQWNPPPGVYDAAVDAAAAWLFGNSPVRGGYVGVGANLGNKSPNRGFGAAAGVGWTIDNGGFGYAGAGLSISRRGRGNDGKFASNTGTFGYGYSYGENGGEGRFFGGGGSNRSGRGAQTLVNRRNLSLGINYGAFNCGLIIDLGKLGM